MKTPFRTTSLSVYSEGRNQNKVALFFIGTVRHQLLVRQPVSLLLTLIF